MAELSAMCFGAVFLGESGGAGDGGHKETSLRKAGAFWRLVNAERDGETLLAFKQFVD